MRNILHISIAAQSDNLGDIEIRRQMIQQYVQRGYDLIVFIGTMPPAYVDAFHLPASSILVSNPLSFQIAVLRNSVRGLAHLAYAPGPHILMDSPKALFKAAGVLGLCAVVRMRGGTLNVIGRSLRGGGRMAIQLERGLRSLATGYAMRDIASGVVLGRKLDVMPDLAFLRSKSEATSSPLVPERDILAMSFRSDRAINQDHLTSLVFESRKRGLRPVLITQVKRDETQHADLARHFGIDFVAWADRTHSEQERLIDSYYARAHAVVSNRLHSLLFGLAHSAFPVALSESNQNKIATTLTPWVPYDSLLLDSPDFSFLDRKEDERQALSAAVAEAGAVLEDYVSTKIPAAS
ncbi:hypothetical protein [Arthrobacter sp. StoSoilB13]|uniref:hypothetical protein n=1 Tax=Arthrobacter sp. StoSoilB13 TaxID=2830993 RepID=UPI001CC3F3E2|nr:hypothetical protein [Arthrobacter sp. StoSoilB13]BCW49579.1 hypothetical protein StoSoilB13_19210 [Arthrobacter sp. StoSoilB13]